MNIKVRCGTRDCCDIVIDVTEYAPLLSVGAGQEDKLDALGILRQEIDTPRFAAPGYRNNQAVNCSIALHVLGYNPETWFENFFEEFGLMFKEQDVSAFMEHLDRVCPYLSTWGPAGSEEYALAYALGY